MQIHTCTCNQYAKSHVYVRLASALCLQRMAAHLQLLDPCPEGGSFVSCVGLDWNMNMQPWHITLNHSQRKAATSAQGRARIPCS